MSNSDYPTSNKNYSANSSAISNTTARIKAAINIVTLIGEYVRLKRRGKHYVGLCPFHVETTPSFTVDQLKQR